MNIEKVVIHPYGLIIHSFPITNHDEKVFKNFIDRITGKFLEEYMKSHAFKQRFVGEMGNVLKKVWKIKSNPSLEEFDADKTTRKKIDDLLDVLITYCSKWSRDIIDTEILSKQYASQGSFSVQIPSFSWTSIYNDYEQQYKESEHDTHEILREYLRVKSHGDQVGFSYPWLALSYISEYCKQFSRRVFNILEQRERNRTVYYIGQQ